MIGQFIQLDEHRGEKTSIESQNRYAYALNNPNKYIDKNGQAAMMMNDGGSGRRKSGGIAGVGRISGKFDVSGAIGSFSKIVSNAAEEQKKAKIKQRNEASKEVLSGLKNLAKGNFITGTSQLVSGSNKATKITKKEVPKPKRYTAETVCTTRPTPIPAPCPETAEQREARLDSLQHMLEFIGFAPGIGEVADGINAAIYYNRGKPFEALISAGCAVFPLVADAVLKPFLWAAGTVVEKVVKITQKIDGFLPSVRAGVSGLSKKLDYIPGFSKAKTEIKQICNKFCGYIDELTVKVNEFIGKSTTIDPKLGEVWNLDPMERGNVIEEILASTEYRDWYNVGSSHGGFFPIIDFQKGYEVISVKTMDLNAKSLQGDKAIKKIEIYLEKLDADIKVAGNPVKKTLDIRIPKGTMDKINMNIIDELEKESKINIKIKEFY